MSSMLLRPLPLDPINFVVFDFRLSLSLASLQTILARLDIPVSTLWPNPFDTPINQTHHLAILKPPPPSAPTTDYHTPCDGDARLNGGERRPAWRITAQLDEPRDRW